MAWRYCIRKIDGRRRKVKVAVINGKERVRIVGFRNYTDRTAPKKNARRRVRRYWNKTD